MKTKYNLGQTVYAMDCSGEYCGCGKINKITIIEEYTGKRKVKRVLYRVDKVGIFLSNLLFDSEDKVLAKIRKTKMAEEQAIITRSKKALLKNEKKLEQLKKELAKIK